MWRDKDTVESVRAQADWEVVLKELGLAGRAGRGEYRALCPFHGDTRPSFYFQLRRGLFYCHGCGCRGDGFGLVMRLRGLSFPEAVDWVAGTCGIRPLTLQRDLLEDLAAYYHRCLWRSEAARQYLQRRGIADSALWKACHIGYAPGGRCGQRFLCAQGYSVEQIRAAGLINRLGLDVLFHRLTLPISDGVKVVNIYGRNLAPDFPHMYLQGRRDVLLGLDVARTMVRGILVEGIFDWLTLLHLGYREAVTGLSAHLSCEQLHLLGERTWQELVIAFDQDISGTGQRAAEILAQKLAGARFQIRLATLPPGRDVNDCLVTDRFTRADFDRIFNGTRGC